MTENSFIPAENIYGHSKRLNWIISHLNNEDTIIEFGCGTGYMITRPLTQMGYNVIGLDLDEESIHYGQKILQELELNPDHLKVLDIAEYDGSVDVIIASEVLEHIPDDNLADTLQVIRNKLKPNGKLLVTVPNGYSWFELESFLWFKVGLGNLLRWFRIDRIIKKFKLLVFNKVTDYPYLSTLAHSPHVQFFTHKTIQHLLCSQGFKVLDTTSSVLVSGPFSNLLFTGINPIMNLNRKLGDVFPRVATGFYIACQLQD